MEKFKFISTFQNYCSNNGKMQNIGLARTSDLNMKSGVSQKENWSYFGPLNSSCKLKVNL